MFNATVKLAILFCFFFPSLSYSIEFMKYCEDGTCRLLRVGLFNPVFDENENLIATNFTGQFSWEEETSLLNSFPQEVVDGVLNPSITDKIAQDCPLLGSYRRRLHPPSGFFVDEAEICSIVVIDGPNFPLPRPMDSDGDEIDDAVDNCPHVSNKDQSNIDDDDFGDVCDDDKDGDGVDNLLDNCPLKANLDQSDQDGDDVGDACDPDFLSEELCIPIKPSNEKLTVVCL